MKERRLGAQQIAIFAAGMLFLALALFAPEADRSATAPPSTFVADAGGARALYRSARELGIDVARWIRPTVDLSVDETPILVVLAPSEPFDPAEAEQLVEWVEDGGALVYAAESEDEVVDALELRLRLGGDEPLARAAELSPDSLALLEESPDSIAARDYTFDASRYEEPDAPGSCEPLYVDEKGRAGIALVRRGAGEVLVIADTAGLTNDSLAGSEVALVALRALATHGAPVSFEEFHHGHSEGDGVVVAGFDWLATTHAGWSVLALFALGFAALVTSGLRQGAALPPPPKRRRSSLEHVVALADAYQRARARGRPSRELVTGLRLALGGGDLEETLAQLQRADASVAADVDLVRAAAGGPVDMVELARAIDRLRAVADPSRKGAQGRPPLRSLRTFQTGRTRARGAVTT